MLERRDEEAAQLGLGRDGPHDDVDDEGDGDAPRVRLEVGKEEAPVKVALLDGAVDAVEREEDAILRA